MPVTPLGHAAVAYASSALTPRDESGSVPRSVSVALVLGGIVPDIDFVAFWAPNFNEFHRIVTHNLVFITLFAALGAVVAHRRGIAHVGVFVGLWIGGLLHLVVDSVMDGNPSNGVGVAYLWPFLDTTFSPFNLIPIVDDPPSWRELDRMIPAVLRGVMFELPFYVAAVLIAAKRRREDWAA